MTEVTSCLTWIVLLRAAAWTVSSKLEKRLVDHGLRYTHGSIDSKVQLEVSYSESNSTHGEMQCLLPHSAAGLNAYSSCASPFFKSYVSTPYYNQNCMLRRRSSGDILHGQLT